MAPPQFIKLFPSGSFKLLIFLFSPHVLVLINNYQHLKTLIKSFFFISIVILWQVVELIRAY